MSDAAELAAHVRDLGERLRRLDAELAPFNNREHWLRTQLKKTHRWVRDAEAPQRPFGIHHDGVQVADLDLTPAAVEARMALWFELDKVRDIAGPVREARRVVNVEYRGARAALERIAAAHK